MYYCGWDGGGTKTALCAIDGAGNPLFEDSFGPLNPNGAAEGTVRDTVREGLRLMDSRLPGGLEACGALTVGMAGVSSRDAVRLVEGAIRERYAGQLRIAGDQEILLNGAVEGPGAVLIAGTGSICYGRDAQGRLLRVGGWGSLIDDGGSGYAIGRLLLMAAVRDVDGRCSAPLIRRLVFEAAGAAEVSDLITWLYAPSTGKREIAALAPLLMEALAQGDMVAEGLADEAARDLSELALTFFQRAELTRGELALTGGVLTHYAPIRERVESLVKAELPDVAVTQPRHSAARGAALMALRLASGG
ncbi:MAG: ATPase [Clostridia bacterium]|nr:ATPase [Clostridia bacterium]